MGRRLSITCGVCGGPASWLVYEPELGPDGTLTDAAAAFSGDRTEPQCRPARRTTWGSWTTSSEGSHRTCPLRPPRCGLDVCVAATPLRANWRGWIHERTARGRSADQRHGKHWHRQAALLR